MIYLVAALFVWCVCLTIALSCHATFVRELAEINARGWKRQLALDEQYDKDITRLEDRTRKGGA